MIMDYTKLAYLSAEGINILNYGTGDQELAVPLKTEGDSKLPYPRWNRDSDQIVFHLTTWKDNKHSSTIMLYDLKDKKLIDTGNQGLFPIFN